MIKLTVADLLASLNVVITSNNSLNFKVDEQHVITDIKLDSRNINSGDVFVAVSGKNHDGHNYLQNAQDNGAVLAVVEKLNPAINIPQILVSSTRLALGDITKFIAIKWDKPKVCITGSNGKTTTKFILASILEQRGQVLCPQASFNNEIGVPLAMFKANDEQWAGVFEIGTNHPGEIAYLSSLFAADVVILTTVSPTHIGNFIDLAAIANEKFNIFNNLKTNGTAIYNHDLHYKDVLIQKLGKLTSINQASFGYDDGANIWADEIHLYSDKTTYRLNYPDNDAIKTADMEINLLGKHQVANALAATAAAMALGLTIDEIKRGLRNVKPVSKRMQAIRLDNNKVVIDDSYNASPASVAAALAYLAQCKGLKVFVIGDLGELGSLGESEHTKIGQLAKDMGIDILFAFGDFSKYVIQAFYDNNSSSRGRKYQEEFADRAELSNTLIRCLKEECQEDIPVTILIKGSNFMRMWEVTERLNSECVN